MNTKIVKKAKTRSKNGKVTVKITLLPDYVLNMNQYEILEKKCRFGFLKLKTIKRNRLEYEGNREITLLSRLKRTISEYDFFFLIEQITDLVQTLDKVGLSPNNLINDLEYVFFNETTKELSFIYLPVVVPYDESSMMSFIQNIIYAVKPEDTNQNYLPKFSYFIKHLESFDAKLLEAYIYEIDSSIIHIIKSGNFSEKNFLNQIAQNNLINEQKKIRDNDFIDRMSEDDLTDLMTNNDSTNMGQNNPQFFENRKNVQNDDDITSLLDDDDQTIMETNISQFTERVPILIRTSTEEVVRINKPVFRIGKEENCVDYIVTNNAAISRNHADIISRDGRYFVFDLRSKNKSYINNRVLPAEKEVEIFHGDILKLANEEFRFQL